MRNPANLTDRDREILDTLALRVRVLSLDQIGRHWFAGTADPARNAKRRLQSLSAAGLVEVFSMPSRPEVRLDAPVARWERGDPPPDFTRLSTRLTRRWTESAVPTDLVIASKRGGGWMGGFGGRRPRRSEVGHDLSLGGVYLRWLTHLRQPGEEWVSEARLRKMGFGDDDRIPDALIQDGSRSTAIEVGGAYPAGKLADFHRFCEGRALTYELW